jgi:hypothetical protein
MFCTETHLHVCSKYCGSIRIGIADIRLRYHEQGGYVSKDILSLLK